MSLTNTTQIHPAIDGLFNQLQSQNFEGQVSFNIASFKETPFEQLFALLQCSDDLIIDQIYSNDFEPNINQFSFEGQFSHSLLGNCNWNCQFEVDHDTNVPYIIATLVASNNPNKLWSWLQSDVFLTNSCDYYTLTYNSKQPLEISVLGIQNDPEHRQFLWSIDGQQQTANLDLQLHTALELKGMFDLSISDLQGQLDWEKDKDVQGKLMGTATFGSKTLPIELAVPSPANELLFTYDNSTNASFSNLADIFEALPLGTQISQLVQPITDLLDGAGIQLNGIQFYIDAHTKRPKSVVVDIQLNKQWQVTEGLTFANPSMRLTLGQHISMENPFWTCELSATMELFKKAFVGKISLPDNTLGFELAADNSISLEDISSAFGFDNSGMPSIALIDFRVDYSLKNKEWNIAAQVKSAISFSIGDQTLQLIEAGLMVNKTPQLTTCMMYGQMAINGKRCEVKMQNNGTGWTLSAHMHRYGTCTQHR